MIKFPDDIIGKRFNRLVVLAFFSGKWQRELWCRCDCGKEKHFTHHQLTSGKVKSCGCYSKEACSKRSFKHGQSGKTPEYKSWCHMKDRCDNPKNQDYHNYGGRGIKYCKRWRIFAHFFADMGKKPSTKHTLDRFPNQNGDYKPTNCRWATPVEQARNVRRNVVLVINGIQKCVAEWGKDAKVSEKLIYQRLDRGWKPYDAVFAPVQKTRRKGLIAYT